MLKIIAQSLLNQLGDLATCVWLFLSISNIPKSLVSTDYTKQWWPWFTWGFIYSVTKLALQSVHELSVLVQTALYNKLKRNYNIILTCDFITVFVPCRMSWAGWGWTLAWSMNLWRNIAYTEGLLEVDFKEELMEIAHYVLQWEPKACHPQVYSKL